MSEKVKPPANGKFLWWDQHKKLGIEATGPVVQGVFGVHKLPDHGDWNVTHIPTGHSVVPWRVGELRKRAEAVRYASLLVALKGIEFWQRGEFGKTPTKRTKFGRDLDRLDGEVDAAWKKAKVKSLSRQDHHYWRVV